MPPPLVKLVRKLAREPFNIPPDRSARMSVRQLALIVATPDDDEAERDESPDVHAIFRRQCVLTRTPDWYADRLWRQRGAGHGG